MLTDVVSIDCRAWVAAFWKSITIQGSPLKERNRGAAPPFPLYSATVHLIG